MLRNCGRIEKNHFLALPNEVLTEIIKLLCLNDRKNLGSINIRLNLLERKAGHRKFCQVEFNSCAQPKLRALDESGTYYYPRENTLRSAKELLHHAKTDALTLEGPLDDEMERKLASALKTVYFVHVSIKVKGVYSGKILWHLVRNKHGGLVRIRWIDASEDIESARRVLLSLPSMNSLLIEADIDLLDNAVLPYLVKKSNLVALFPFDRLCWQNITEDGFEKAFEVVYKSSSKKNVVFTVLKYVYTNWLNRIDTNSFAVTGTRVVHFASGAFIEFIDEVEFMRKRFSCVRMVIYPE